MQRNITYKSFIKYVVWSLLFALYAALSTVYLFLPPMIGVLFLLFHYAQTRKNSLLLLFVLIDVVILEALKGFLAFSLLLYFLLQERFIIPKIKQSINARHLRNFLYVAFSYFGYFLFSALLAQIFLLPRIELDFYIVYYIVVEFLIVSIAL